MTGVQTCALPICFPVTIIDKKTLDKNFEISAITDDNIIMAINHIKYPLYGIQFHPESIKTNFGNVIFKNFLKIK